MSEQAHIPSPQESDSDEIRWALETARSLWTSDALEALRWLRRAAETASDDGDDLRSVQLARAAADLRSAANIQGSMPPPASVPPAGALPPTATGAVAPNGAGVTQPRVQPDAGPDLLQGAPGVAVSDSVSSPFAVSVEAVSVEALSVEAMSGVAVTAEAVTSVEAVRVEAASSLEGGPEVAPMPDSESALAGGNVGLATPAVAGDVHPSARVLAPTAESAEVQAGGAVEAEPPTLSASDARAEAVSPQLPALGSPPPPAPKNAPVPVQANPMEAKPAQGIPARATPSPQQGSALPPLGSAPPPPNTAPVPAVIPRETSSLDVSGAGHPVGSTAPVLAQLRSATETPLIGAGPPAPAAKPPPLPVDFGAPPPPTPNVAPSPVGAGIPAEGSSDRSGAAVATQAGTAAASTDLPSAPPATASAPASAPAAVQPAAATLSAASVDPEPAAVAAQAGAEETPLPGFVSHQALRVAFNPESDEFGQLLVRPLIEGETPPPGWVTALLVGLDSGKVVLTGGS